jgi:glutamate--cysteine ligase
LHALRERGVEYVEVRLLDLNPFEPVGINAQAMRFIDVFLLHCLLSDSPNDTPQEITELARNQHLTAARGREPGLKLLRGGREVPLTDWADELLQAFAPIARALDAANGCGDYSAAVRSAVSALHEPARLPSARVLAAMAASHDNSFVAFSRAQSLQTRQGLLDLPWQPAQQARFEAMARQSLEDQKKIETADTMPFEIFRQEYVSPKRLGLLVSPTPQEIAHDQGQAQHQREPSHQR